MNNECKKFWGMFLTEEKLPQDTTLFEVFYISDYLEFADYLAEAVISGKKTGTTSLIWELESREVGTPMEGDYSLVTYANGSPACVIQTTNIDVVPFNDVTSEFAVTEGEEDSSIENWREYHWKEFSQQCKRLNLSPSETMPVICKGIRVVYS